MLKVIRSGLPKEDPIEVFERQLKRIYPKKG